MLEHSHSLNTQQYIEYEQKANPMETTMDLNTQAIISADSGNESEPSEDYCVWALMYPIQDGLLRIKCKEGAAETLTFGRAIDCNVSFCSMITNLDLLKTLSAFHFHMKLSPDKTAYIVDTSTNGTFVNKERLTRGVPRPLVNGDSISLISPRNVFYNFVLTKPDPYVNGRFLYSEQLLAKYIMSGMLGKGSYGEVRLAFSKINPGKYAIKILQKKQFTGKRNTLNNHEKLRKEADILRQVSHPCITTVEDLLESDTHLYIILEYVNGGELFDRLTSGPLQEYSAKFIMYQVCSAIEYLHRNNITHRDVKPENILMSSRSQLECRVKLTDFGLSRLVGSCSAMKTYCGTPSYLAPEVFTANARSTYSRNVDVWSAGVILYICITGEMPFDEQDSQSGILENRDNVLNREPWIRHHDKCIGDLLPRMLEIDPKHRYSSSQVVRHVWFQSDMKMLESVYAVTTGIVGPIRSPAEKRSAAMQCDEIDCHHTVTKRLKECAVKSADSSSKHNQFDNGDVQDDHANQGVQVCLETKALRRSKRIGNAMKQRSNLKKSSSSKHFRSLRGKKRDHASAHGEVEVPKKRKP